MFKVLIYNKAFDDGQANCDIEIVMKELENEDLYELLCSETPEIIVEAC